MRRFTVGWLVALGALGCLVVPISSALGYTAGPPPPWSICFSASQADLGVLEASLSPANGATVSAGAPVIFSGHSESMPTFAVASSAALLSSPDIDSGPGSAQPQPSSSGPPVVYAYAFSSTKATATPGTVYWQASFSSAGIAECTGLTPSTYTTAVRTLTIVPAPSPPPAPVIPEAPVTPPPATATVAPDGSTIAVQSSGEAAVKLTCTDTATCDGKLTLTAKSTTGKGKKRRSRTETIGAAKFSVAAGKTISVRLALNAAGQRLLKVDRGHLAARLTILQTDPEATLPQTHSENVQLVRERAMAR
jgi:hypothetical protein